MAMSNDVRVDVLTVRDPDGGTNVTVFIGGVPVREAVHHTIDAGAGWTYEDWQDSRASDLAEVANFLPRDQYAQLFSALVDAWDNPPGDKYIDGWGEDDLA